MKIEAPACTIEATMLWTVIFSSGIILISCKDMNYITTDSDENWLRSTSSIRRQQFINNRVIIPDRAKQTNNDVSASYDAKYKSLSPYDFSPWLARILSPEIFSQSNPLVYLLDKIVGSSVTNSLSTDVNFFLRSNQFPSYYVPYAKMLLALLTCEPDLKKIQRAIFDIRHSTNTRFSSFTLPAELATPELSAVFSPDVFSDPKPPSVIFEKTMNIRKKAMSNFISELDDISWYGPIPPQYASYAKRLGYFLKNRAEFEALKAYYVEMKKVPTAPTE